MMCNDETPAAMLIARLMRNILLRPGHVQALDLGGDFTSAFRKICNFSGMVISVGKATRINHYDSMVIVYGNHSYTWCFIAGAVMCHRELDRGSYRS